MTNIFNEQIKITCLIFKIPSKIVIAEALASQSNKKKLKPYDKLALFLRLPMLHLRYTKNDKEDMAYSLSRDYSQVPKDIPSDILDIVQTRQNGLIRRARTTLGSWCGSIISFSLVSYSIRFYDWKSKLIILPFTTYGGCLLGRFISHGITGR